jgi:hypothetical protein
MLERPFVGHILLELLVAAVIGRRHPVQAAA